MTDLFVNKSFGYRLKKSIPAYLFLAPLIILIAVFSYYPAVSGIFHSFFDWRQTSEATFVGLQNYITLFKDPIFLNSIPVMVKLMLPRLLISIVCPLVMAELLFHIRSKRLQSAYRMWCLLPMVAPGVVGILLWRYIYDPSGGLAVSLLRTLGIVAANQNIDWLGNPSLVIGSLIFMGFPWVGGTSVMIYLSGLLGISNEVIEASMLDGASVMRRIFSIHLPLIKGQIRYFLVFGIINALQDYSFQIVLTNGGPGYSTYVPGFYMYKQAFTYGNMGYASAIGTVLFLVIFSFTVLTMKFKKSDD